MFKKVVKRDGKIVNFNPEKIVEAIAKAGLATEEFKADRAKALADKVIKRAEETIKARTPNVEQIQDIVEQVLMESAFKKTARAYITYRQERSKVREAKSDLMSIYKTISHADASRRPAAIPPRHDHRTRHPQPDQVRPQDRRPGRLRRRRGPR